ncbi:MAG: hypothetical protein AAF628_34860 [Planctomycetota bacterium]
MNGDVVLVDPDARGPLPLDPLRSRAGWSRFGGVEPAGWPVVTVLRGQIAYRDGAPGGAPRGQPLRYG